MVVTFVGFAVVSDDAIRDDLADDEDVVISIEPTAVMLLSATI